MARDLLWRCQHRLQVLLYFVHVGEHLPLEGEERWVRSWGQVVKISWPPDFVWDNNGNVQSNTHS